jgi:ribosome-associated translation inhibitor RaiA
MRTIVQSPSFKPSDELIDFGKKSVENLSSFGIEITEGRILLKTGKANETENKICELKLILSGNDLLASEKASTFEDAIAKTVEVIKKQLLRLKEFNEKKTFTRL